MRVIPLSGVVDMATTPGLQHTLAESVTNTERGVVLDLSEVEHIDSAGIRWLFGLSEVLRTRRQELRVVVPLGAPIRTVLGLVDLSAAAAIHPTVDDALQ